MMTALRHPDWIKRLLVVDVAPVKYPSADVFPRYSLRVSRREPTADSHHDFISNHSYIEAMRNVPLDSDVTRSEIERILEASIPVSHPNRTFSWFCHSLSSWQDTTVRKFLLTNLVIDRDTKRYSWKVNLEAIAKWLPEIRRFDFCDTDDQCSFEGEFFLLVSPDSSHS